MGDEAAPASGGLLRFIFAAFFFTSHLSAAVKILVDDDVARFTEGVDSQSLIRDVLSSTVAPFTMKDLFESVLAKGQVPLFSLSELLANLTFPLPDNSRTLFDPHFFINQEFTSEGVTCHLLDIHHLSMKSTYRPNEDKHDTAVAKNPFVMLNITLNDVFVDCQGEWQVSAHAFRSKYPFGEGPLSIQTHVEKLYILARVDVQDNHPLMHAFSMQVIVDDVKQVSVLDCNTDLTFAVNVGASYSIIDTVSQKASAMLRSTVEAELCSHIRSTSFAEGFTRLPFFSRVMLQMPLSSLSKNVATSSSRFRASKVANMKHTKKSGTDDVICVWSDIDVSVWLTSPAMASGNVDGFQCRNVGTEPMLADSINFTFPLGGKDCPQGIEDIQSHIENSMSFTSVLNEVFPRGLCGWLDHFLSNRTE